MFTMDVPYTPAQDTPIVLAQAAAPGTTTLQPNYILKDCQEIESTGNPRSAGRAVDPAYMLKNYIQGRDNRDVDLASIKTTLLQGTMHGELLSSTSNYGRTTYHYNPPNYVGNDKAVFMAEFEGKRYKIVVELHVFEIVWENDPTASSCPAPELIKVNRKPVSGSTGYDSGYSFGSLSVILNLADLPGGAVGQTVGTTITLDTNAAGNNWFIDTKWNRGQTTFSASITPP